MKKIPFDLEIWKSGKFKRLINRKGIEVTEIYFFESDKGQYPIHYVANGAVHSVTKNGLFYNMNDVSNNDLFMEIEAKKIWINVFKSKLDNNRIFSMVYEDKELADSFRKHDNPTLFVTQVETEI